VKSFQVEAGRPEVRSGWKVSLDEEHRELIKTLKRINGQVLFKDADIQANDNSGAFIIRVMFEAFANHYCEKASDSLYKREIIPVDWHKRMDNSEGEKRYR
jgi:hypothetical protein